MLKIDLRGNFIAYDHKVNIFLIKREVIDNDRAQITCQGHKLGSSPNFSIDKLVEPKYSYNDQELKPEIKLQVSEKNDAAILS